MMSSATCNRSLRKLAFSSGPKKSRLAISAVVLMTCAAAVLSKPLEATSVDKSLTATPLVLKDGRIAEVSVHTIPFPDDAVAPSSKTRKALNTFTESIATDCFLTAQVIGHVDKAEISGRETADIHRLARARADTIQSSLIDNGLPAASIASVWDWRFMVQQPRVTLWVFRLTAGEDCENTPLGRGGEDQTAATSSTLGPVESSAIPTVETSEATSPSTVSRAKESSPAVKQHVIPAARPRSEEPATPLPVKAAAAGKKVTDGGTRIAAIEPKQSVDDIGAAEVASNGALEITFATNSSFFPEGAGDQLRAFLKTLDKGKRYVLHIQTSLDSSAGVSGATSKDEAQRYNAWMAERRFNRVEAWLLKNSDGREFTIEPTLIENDGSRRVRIEPTPLG